MSCVVEDLHFKYEFKVNGSCIFEHDRVVTVALIVVCVLAQVAIFLSLKKAKRILVKMTTPSSDVKFDETYCVFSKYLITTVVVSLYAAEISNLIFLA